MKKLDGTICDSCGTLIYDHNYDVCGHCFNNVYCVINVYEDGSEHLSSIHHTLENAELHIKESQELIDDINTDSNYNLVKQVIENWLVF